MNAAPADPPAYVVPAPPRFGLRIGAGVGGGGEGLAGNYFAAVDYWPLVSFGIGTELEHAASIARNGQNAGDTDDLTAFRLRLSLRARIGPKAFLTGALGLGFAGLFVNRGGSACENDPDHCGRYPSVYASTTSASAAFELGIHGQFGAFETSWLVRVSATGPGPGYVPLIGMLTMGPAVGFGGP